MERKRTLATYAVVFCVASATMAYELASDQSVIRLILQSRRVFDRHHCPSRIWHFGCVRYFFFSTRTGLRYLEGYYPRFISSAWGVNGLRSVMASILAILLAMRTGFTTVIVLGSLTNGAGYLAIRRHLQRN